MFQSKRIIVLDLFSIASWAIYETFANEISDNFDKLQVHHKDNNGHNNAFSNLELTTRKQNARYRGTHKFNERAVDQFDLDGNLLNCFPTIKDAQKHVGLKSASGIVLVCKNQQSNAGGCIWKYVEKISTEKINHVPKVLNPMYSKQDLTQKTANIEWKTIRKGVDVVQLDLNGQYIAEFDSAEAAAQKIDGDRSSIIRVCKGKRKTHRGFIWKYAAQYYNSVDGDDSEEAEQKNKRIKTI